ncbi:MAG: PEP-CTERM sorting domain-containing protein, partial [Planctomycetes bacterium]|nr:PEP-CTERM sorting domain-containing protein [Planctomycetota bacterium]
MTRLTLLLTFTSAVSLALFCGSAVQAATLTAYYDFEGNFNDFPGAGVFADDLTTVASGASLVADGAANAVGSTMSYAFDARTGDSRVSTAGWSADLTSTDQYTIMFWLKADDDNQQMNNTRLATVRYDAANASQGSGVGWQIEGFGLSGNGNGPDLRIQGGTVGNFFAPAANGALGNDGDPPGGTPDDWHHVAYVISNTGGPGGLAYMETFLDGTSLNVSTNVPTTDTNLLQNPNGRLILGGHNQSNRSATGQLDDFALVDGVLDPQIISQIASGQMSPADLLAGPEPPSGATILKPVAVTTSITGDAGSSHQYLLDDNAGHTAASLQRPVGTGVTLNTGDPVADALATFHERSAGGHAESWTRPIGSGLPEFVFDLTGGGDTSVESILLWQYGNNGGGEGRIGNATKDFRVILHTEAEGATFDFGTETADIDDIMEAFLAATTESNTAQLFDFASIQNARYAAVRIDDNYGGEPGIIAGGDRYGLGEVRFVAPGASAVPEPSTFALAALGLLGLGL